MPFGGQDHDHPLAFELGLTFDLGQFAEIGFEFFHEGAAKIDVGHLAATELEVELNFVAFFEEGLGVIELGILIVIVDTHGIDAEFLELCDVRGVGFLFFLPLAVFPFAVIHQAADRRLLLGGDFDEVEPGLARQAKRFEGRDNADLLVGLIDQSNGCDTNLLVATQTVLANGKSSCVTPEN